MIWIIEGVNIIGAVDYFLSCIWAVQFFGMSEFELTVPCTEENLNLLKKGRILARNTDRSGTLFDNCMIIRKVSLTYDSEHGYLLKVSGTGLKGLLSQRIIWDQYSITDTAVQVVVREMVLQNAVRNDERGISNLTIDYTGDVATEEASFQLHGENLAKWIEAVATQYGFGWDIVLDDGQYVFKLYAGTDRTRNQGDVPPVVFSENMDNLIDCEFTVDYETFKNAAQIGGEGEGTAQTTASIGTSEDMERFEAYIDGSAVSSNGSIISAADYEAMLQQYGEEQIAELKKTVSFSATVDTEAPYKVNEDFFIGDIVEVAAGFGINATARLIEIIFSEDQNGTQAVGNFTEWEVE
jgi:hypothetical protein